MQKLLDGWDGLLSFLPAHWLELAEESGALKGLRQDKDPENLLRTLLIHCGCGYSLRETALRAREAGLANLSDVGILKRLRKSHQWLKQLCLACLHERGLSYKTGINLRLFDATHVKEPGKTGSQWRLHYSLCLPELCCDHFELSPATGVGTGENFSHFKVKPGDYILADRGYSLNSGLSFIIKNKAYATVRWHSRTLPLYNDDGSAFDLSGRLQDIRQAGQMACWPVWIKAGPDQTLAEGRVCVIRKDEADARKSKELVERKFVKKGYRCKGYKIKELTLFYSQYVIVFSNFPADVFSMEAVLKAYRLRWQIELVFKRFKQLAGIGHLPKYDELSSKAWLYGKLLAALLAEKMIAYAGAISPWSSGKSRKRGADYQPLETFLFYVSSIAPNDRATSELGDNLSKLDGVRQGAI